MRSFFNEMRSLSQTVGESDPQVKLTGLNSEHVKQCLNLAVQIYLSNFLEQLGLFVEIRRQGDRTIDQQIIRLHHDLLEKMNKPHYKLQSLAQSLTTLSWLAQTVKKIDAINEDLGGLSAFSGAMNDYAASPYEKNATMYYEFATARQTITMVVSGFLLTGLIAGGFAPGLMAGLWIAHSLMAVVNGAMMAHHDFCSAPMTPLSCLLSFVLPCMPIVEIVSMIHADGEALAVTAHEQKITETIAIADQKVEEVSSHLARL